MSSFSSVSHIAKRFLTLLNRHSIKGMRIGYSMIIKFTVHLLIYQVVIPCSCSNRAFSLRASSGRSTWSAQILRASAKTISQVLTSTSCSWTTGRERLGTKLQSMRMTALSAGIKSFKKQIEGWLGELQRGPFKEVFSCRSKCGVHASLGSKWTKLYTEIT